MTPYSPAKRAACIERLRARGVIDPEAVVARANARLREWRDNPAPWPDVLMDVDL